MSEGNEQLAKALESIAVDPGIANDDDWTMIANAPPDSRCAAQVYATVNRHLESLVQNRPLPIYHITGEARALVDPAHRRVLRAGHARGAQARLACSFHSEELSAWEFVGGEHQHWIGVTWYDLVDILALGAREVIRIFRLDTPAQTHFSIFGDDLVLLQEPHHHPQLKKWVWFVQSRSLAEAALPHLEARFSEAAPIEPSSFNEVLVWLNSYETFEALAGIATERPVGQGALAEDEDRERRDRLANLGLAEPDGRALTQLGREWLDRISTAGGG